MQRISSFRQLANLIGFISIIVVTVLFAPNPKSTRSQEFGLPTVNSSSVLFYPADLTFAVWLPIFVLLGAFAVYQALPAQRDNPVITRMGYWFALNMAFYVGFTLCINVGQANIASLMLLGEFATLIVIYVRTGIGTERLSRRDQWLVKIPMDTYLGWLSVATILTISGFLSLVGWDGFSISAETWTVVLIGIASVLAILLLLTRHNVALLLVVMWAIFGITIAHPAYTAIQISVVIMEIVLAGVLLVWILTRGRGIAPLRYDKRSSSVT